MMMLMEAVNILSVELQKCLSMRERSFVEEDLPPVLKREFPDGVLYKNDDTQEKIIVPDKRFSSAE